MARERMGSLNLPIDIVRNMGKELAGVAGRKAFEHFANPRECY
jgi:hypothetical protein